jgi:carbon storage regulator
MLVMSRREGDTILIGDEIEIVISHIGRSKVKVGIRAPRTVPVIAREVKLVRDQNLAAATGPLSSPGLTSLLSRLKPASGAAPGESRKAPVSPVLQRNGKPARQYKIGEKSG